MKKVFLIFCLALGVQGIVSAGCDTCTWDGGIYIDPVGGGGPTPTGGDDVPHHAAVLYYYGSYYFIENVAGMNKSQCEAGVAQITSNPNYSYVEVRLSCRPAY